MGYDRDMSTATRARLRRHLLLTVVTLLAVILLVETGLRAWIAYGADDVAFRRYASIDDFRSRGSDGIFVRHAYLGYVPRPGYVRGANRHDSLGFRGDEVQVPKPDGEFRVVCVGGSTTYSQGIEDWRGGYPARLEEELRAHGLPSARVVNAGVPNWTSYEHLVSYPFRLRELGADLLVVLEGVNDVKARLVVDPRDYRADNSGYRTFTTNLTMPPLREHFATWRFVAVNAGWMRPHSDLERSLDNHTGLSLWGELRAQMQDGSYPSGIFSEHPADAILANTPPVHFEHNLRDIVVLAALDGTETLLLSSPSCTARIAKSAEAARVFEDGLRQMADAARRTAESSHARWFDLAAHVPRDPALFLDESHWNEAGAREVARHVSAAIVAARPSAGR